MKKDTSRNIRPTTLAALLVVLATLHVVNTTPVNSNDISVRYNGTQLWRIDYIPEHRQSQWLLLKRLEEEYGADIWEDNLKYVDFTIDKKHVEIASSFLKYHNLTLQILNLDVQKLFEKEMGVNPTEAEEAGLRSRSVSGSRMHWNDYQDVDTIYDYLHKICDKNADICTLHTIGKSVEGRPLFVLEISEDPKNYKKIWIDGGIHAREWISPATVTFIINELLTNWKQKPDYIKQKTWYIMPLVNPDGYHYSRTKDRMWRKNRAITNNRQCIGVDLNRNFDIAWSGTGSSTDPCRPLYRGPSPASEPETAAVVKFLIDNQSSLEAYLTYHSFSQLIVYPWAYKREKVHNDKELQRVANLAVQHIKKLTKNTYIAASTHERFAPAGGGSDDWVRAALGTKYVYTVELRDSGKYGFILPPNQILNGAMEGYIIADTVAQEIKNDNSDRIVFPDY